ncbi:LysR family transcriptional regulator [Blastococcus sp. SYSU D00820]
MGRPATRLRALDANLLHALRALLQEGNVTRAAETLTVSQPMMSTALARLRAHFQDDLLRRVGRGYELTPLARDLLPRVQDTLDVLAGALRREHTFDPRTSTRHFTVVASDHALAMLVKRLLAELTRQAPGVTVDFRSYPTSAADPLTDLLVNDLLIGPVDDHLPGRRRVVLEDEYAVVVGADNPRLRDGRLTVEDVCRLPHAVAARGDLPPGALEELAATAGLTRTVTTTVAGLLALPYVVSGTDLCAVLPRRLARRCPPALGLVVADVPLALPRAVEAAHWHPSRAADPGLTWLLDVLAEVAPPPAS